MKLKPLLMSLIKLCIYLSISFPKLSSYPLKEGIMNWSDTFTLSSTYFVSLPSYTLDLQIRYSGFYGSV